MEENFTEMNSTEEYWRLGGALDKASVDQAKDTLATLTNGEKPTVKNSFLVQAEQMAKFSKVPITPEQKYVYAVLREVTKETQKKSDASQEKLGVKPAWKLSDQPLLAEVLLITGDSANRGSFMAAYPNIFDKKK